MSKVIKQLKKKMEENNVNPGGGKYLRLGIKNEKGVVKPTGFHKVKLVKEPEVEKKPHYKTQIERQVLVLTLEEDGVKKLYDFPIYSEKDGETVKDEDGNPTAHYLINSLEPISVGDEFGLEMKKSGIKSFIEVTYPLDDQDTEDGIPTVDVDAEFDDIDDIPFG